MLSINNSEEERVDAVTFFERTRYTFVPLQASVEFWMDLSKKLGVTGFTANLLLDGEGRLVYVPHFDGLEGMRRTELVLKALIGPDAGRKSVPR
ncbi:MAG: hypothetical protein AB1806_00880 [Acidobacteriota bacterium]